MGVVIQIPLSPFSIDKKDVGTQLFTTMLLGLYNISGLDHYVVEWCKFLMFSLLNVIEFHLCNDNPSLSTPESVNFTAIIILYRVQVIRLTVHKSTLRSTWGDQGVYAAAMHFLKYCIS